MTMHKTHSPLMGREREREKKEQIETLNNKQLNNGKNQLSKVIETQREREKTAPSHISKLYNRNYFEYEVEPFFVCVPFVAFYAMSFNA